MYSRNESIPPSLRLLGNDERAWEGHYNGRHWIARVVQVDESNGVCGVHVASGAERDQLTAKANCRWDYENDHFIDRFSTPGVPPELPGVMLGALRDWLERFRAQRQGGMQMQFAHPSQAYSP
jgi:hypothetical protein